MSCQQCHEYTASKDGLCSQCWKRSYPERWEELERVKAALREPRVQWEKRWDQALADEHGDALKALLEELHCARDVEEGQMKLNSSHVSLLESYIRDSLLAGLRKSPQFAETILRAFYPHGIPHPDCVLRDVLRTDFPELLDVVAQIPSLREQFTPEFTTDCAYDRFCSIPMYLKLCENDNLLPFIPWTSAKVLKDVKHLGSRTNGGKSESSEQRLKATLDARSRLLALRKSQKEQSDGFAASPNGKKKRRVSDE